jgi:Leucine-rich repeat (LRR) protein
MAYTLRINDTYVQSSALDITAAVQKYIESDDSTELVVYSDNRYRSRGPLLDLSVIDSRYTVLELTGVSVYNIDSLYDTVEILDVHNAGEYTAADEVLSVLPLSIEQLSLTYYRITGSIGPAIEDFDRLVVLDLSRNELSGQLDLYLPILRELYLDYNSIDSIADSVYSMDSLVILSMKYNRLKRNPTKRLNSMKSLEYVDLRGNPFYGRRRS